MSNDKDFHDKVMLTLSDINSLSKCGNALSHDTSLDAADISVLFDVIQEKSDWLEKQLDSVRAVVAVRA